MAYSVTRRTREIGIRMALGADRQGVVRLFLREALRLGVTGLLLGALPAIGVTYLLSSLLVGVSVADPVVLPGAGLLLLVATVAAAWIPARRATHVDPIVALRNN
jgi:ABC-type antimicrobial peptide transport system permease subunit